MNKKLLSAMIITMACSCTIAHAAKNTNYNYTPQQYNPQQYAAQPQGNMPYSSPLKGQVTFVPAGTAIPALTTMELSSENLMQGQSVALALGQNFYYGNKLIAPAGSSVNGFVTVLKKAGRAGKNAQLQVRFQNIMTPQGIMIPISGIIKTEDGTGLLKGGTAMDTTKDYAKDIAVGAGAGALSGLVVSAISGGSLGKGTAITTGIGAGVGLGKSLLDKGGAITIPANSQIEIILQQPMTVNSY